MRPTTTDTRPVDPELVPLAELRAQLLAQQRRSKGKAPKVADRDGQAQKEGVEAGEGSE
jgi:hypothetical protein